MNLDKLDPAIIRHLLYRIIGGVKIELDHMQLHELQVLAELVPSVWNDLSAGSPPRVMNQYSQVFTGGYCLGCSKGIIYHDGTDNPLQTYCGHCDNPHRRGILSYNYNLAKYALANDFLQWEPKYQLECIKFLVEVAAKKNAAKWREGISNKFSEWELENNE